MKNRCRAILSTAVAVLFFFPILFADYAWAGKRQQGNSPGGGHSKSIGSSGQRGFGGQHEIRKADPKGTPGGFNKDTSGSKFHGPDKSPGGKNKIGPQDNKSKIADKGNRSGKGNHNGRVHNGNANHHNRHAHGPHGHWHGFYRSHWFFGGWCYANYGPYDAFWEEYDGPIIIGTPLFFGGVWILPLDGGCYKYASCKTCLDNEGISRNSEKLPDDFS